MSWPDLARIEELDQLNELYSLEDEYTDEHGSPPFNLSHWDPSEEIASRLHKFLRLPLPTSAVPYVYPGDLDNQTALIERFGTVGAQECIALQAGTNAILFAMWWIKEALSGNLAIVCPAYFPVFYAANIMGVPHSSLAMERKDGAWSLPHESISTFLRCSNGTPALWITSPIYCTGVYLVESDLKFLESLLNRGIGVVADECLAMPGNELAKRFGKFSNFLSLYSPHKSICLNSVKFAVLLFEQRFRSFFRDWADVFVGGLSASNHIAIKHFIDGNFAEYRNAFLAEIDRVRREVGQLVSRNSPAVQVDRNTTGHFISLYFPSIPAASGDDREFIRSFISNTGALVIPATRNHFDSRLGFAFRINLARNSGQFWASLQRTIRYLADRTADRIS